MLQPKTLTYGRNAFFNDKCDQCWVHPTITTRGWQGTVGVRWKRRRGGLHICIMKKKLALPFPPFNSFAPTLQFLTRRGTLLPPPILEFVTCEREGAGKKSSLNCVAAAADAEEEDFLGKKLACGRRGMIHLARRNFEAPPPVRII